jgi:hypothetical protein
LTGEAVNVTDEPEQAGFDEAAIVTLTGRFELTIMLIALDVTGLPVTQTALEVITQVTKSPFAGVNE